MLKKIYFTTPYSTVDFSGGQFGLTMRVVRREIRLNRNKGLSINVDTHISVFLYGYTFIIVMYMIEPVKTPPTYISICNQHM